MIRNPNIASAVRRALLMSAVAASVASLPAQAQDQDQEEEVTTVTVTGTRINVPGIVSSSPIYSVGAQEIQFQQQPEVEKILRLLPITAPSDGQNANNGSAGAATINLRGLGSQRNLILVDGKRATPYNFNGLVDTSMIPTALIERIDIVTGGASAVYGSDAISGALNFILKRDFEGVELNTDFSQTEESDGEIRNAAITLGSNVAEGRGNVVLSINWTDREGVQLGDRPLGQLGIVTATGGGLAQFEAGTPPTPPPAGCGGPNSVDVTGGGSATTLPTRLGIAGAGSVGQFREDGSLGANCSVFNFNPYNYYQTPQERFGGMVLGRFEINEHAEPYARFAFGTVKVRTQVAPSGIFNSAFWTPLANPFITAQAQAAIITAAEAARTNPMGATLVTGGTFPNWRDLDSSGNVTAADDLRLQYNRRTVEFGERSTTYNNDAFQIILGQRGNIIGDWDYDVAFSYGESDRSNISAGYSNVTNAALAIDSVSTTTCRSGGSCVPLNLMGGFGAITPEMAAFSGASAIEQQAYEQQILGASVSGPIEAIKLPWAANSLAVSIGAEYREEVATTTPDECLKLAPASCLGGAGGNTLPITGGFDVSEAFAEAIFPIVSDVPFMQSLDIELGYRHSDYNLTGTDETYKYGLNWKPVDQLLIRGMFQRAARAPNVGELAAPQTAGLDNAIGDPCSVFGVANGLINPTLTALCIGTGMSAGQVGIVPDIVVGQINGFFGTNLADLPAPEAADTSTLGFVWTPDFGDTIRSPVISVDYYDIDIADVVGEFGAQEVLDGCYVLADPVQCAKVRRVGGNLVLPGSGVELFTTNLDYLRAEGVEVGFSFRFDTERFGSLTFMGNVNKYLTQESQSSSTTPVLDCLGRYGTSCLGPLPEMRWIQRTTWDYRDFTVSALWRHLGDVEIEEVQKANTFDQFEKLDAVDYIDLYGSYELFDKVRISAGIVNLLDEEPPVVGNEAADTRSNSGNTFPSMYDVLGRTYSLGVNVAF